MPLVYQTSVALADVWVQRSYAIETCPTAAADEAGSGARPYAVLFEPAFPLIEKITLWRCAPLLVKRHGNDVVIVAAQRATSRWQSWRQAGLEADCDRGA